MHNSVGRGGLRGIKRDHEGSWILSFTQSALCTVPIEAEWKALIRGLQVAQNHNLIPLEVNTDSLAIINMLGNGNARYDNFICQCRYIISRMEKVVLKHVFREQNQVAHMLAKERAKQGNYGNIKFFVTPPVFVDKLFKSDYLRTYYV